MAAHAKYPTAHAQLLALARRARLEGVAFEVFWERAVRPGLPPVIWRTPVEMRPAGCVVWPNDTHDRGTSQTATVGAKEGWQRAYEGLPAPQREHALERLRPMLDRFAEDACGNGAAEPVRSAA